MLKYFRLLILFYLFIFTTPSLFALEESQIPPSLMEWKSWVLDDLKERDCPIDYQTNEPVCNWESRLTVSLNGDRLDFNMTVTSFKEKSQIALPTANQSWVTNVLVDGKKAIVLGADVQTVVVVSKGVHQIQGSIPWKKNLNYLQIPENIALVNLYKNNEKVPLAKVDQNSRLWLDKSADEGSKKGTLAVSLYRKIIDGHPIKMETYLHLSASGKMRSVVLDGIMLEGFLPISVKSSLNATINEDKKLEVEIKAGESTVKIESYNPNNITKLEKPKYAFAYENQEVWTLQTDSDYRTIEVEGAVSIDPSQTSLPNEWKTLQAYLIEEDKGLIIKELYKSAKQQQKNELTLNREMWLDFEGKGYTLNDTISGSIAQVRRLESTNLLDLASVSINNQPTLITMLSNTTQKGVELREEHLNIKASSRYEGDISLIPANGWDEKFNSVNTTLHLPAGWRLFAVFGSDNKTTAWLDQWDLMDLFLVLLLVIAIYQMYGLKWAIPATLFLVLLWHEENAPTIIWLFIVGMVALLRVLPQGRLQKFLKIVMAFIVAMTLLQVLTFSVYEIRTALYPQLETHDNRVDYGYASNAPISMPMSRAKIVPSYVQKEIYQEELANVDQSNMAQQSFKSDKIMQNRIDPNAVVQTGVGIPQWQWRSYEFSWQSGVKKDETLTLWLISLILNKVLKILNVVGMLFLLMMFLREFAGGIMPNLKKNLMPTEVTKALLLFCLLAFSPPTLKANTMPSEQLLQELKEKLTQSPTCLPHCAEIEKVDIAITDDTLIMTMNISAGANVAVPVLGNRYIWLPQSVMVDGSKEVNLHLDSEGHLWLMLSKGVHQVVLSGTIKGENQLMLSSLLPLHNVKAVVKGDLWRVNSDNKSYIEVMNLNEKLGQAKEKEQSKIEPFIEVERTFYFGLRWYVDTDVKLLNEIDKPYTLLYDLLENESILDKEIEVANRQAVLHLQNSKNSYHWHSSLPITKTLHLKGSSKEQIMETWQMDIASIWDMTYQGVEPIEQVKVGELLMPRFKPWKNEELNVTLEKAKAVKGESLTIESSSLDIMQSARYRDMTLDLKVKSSQAGQYTLSLKNVAELKSTTIDGTAHYLQMNNEKVSLPLQAKAQNIKLSWREEIGTNVNYLFPMIDLAKESVNNSITLNLPDNRWILWTSGPTVGPAVLLWGVLLSMLLFAIILGKIKGSPLKTRDWLLLGVGVSTTSIMIMLPVVIWIFALRFREYKGDALIGWRRNLTQIGLVILTFIALGTIVSAVSIGLLGSPDMIITGNNSYGHTLNWYSDRIVSNLPEPTVISFSIWYYRALMLLWSIWIAFSLIKWLKWSWSIFSQGDMWAKRIKKENRVDV